MSNTGPVVIINDQKITPEFVDLVKKRIVGSGLSRFEMKDFLFATQSSIIQDIATNGAVRKDLSEISFAIDQLYNFCTELDELILEGKF